jgi:hypothetical protein
MTRSRGSWSIAPIRLLVLRLLRLVFDLREGIVDLL